MMGNLVASAFPSRDAADANVARLAEMFDVEASLARVALHEAQGDVNRAATIISDAQQAEAAAKRGVRAAAVESRLASKPRAQTKATAGNVKSSAAAPPQPLAAEERIKALVARLSMHPQAVDTLLYVLSTLLQSPEEAKFREVKTSNQRFQDTVARAPKEVYEPLFAAMGFTRSSPEWLSLPRNFDMWPLIVCKESLEAAQRSAMYLRAREAAAFNQLLSESRALATLEELERRAAFAKLLPPAPEEGAAGTTRIGVTFGSGPFSAARRRFAADDTLADVRTWLGAEHSSLVAGKLQSGEFVLVNATLRETSLLDLKRDADKTLHALGLWPGAELAVKLKKGSDEAAA
jgi:hypothetical protein